MNIKKISKAFIAIMVIGGLLQAGVISYSIASGTSTDSTQTTVETTDTTEDIDINDIEISQEILDLIQELDPINYEKNVNNYKTLLLKLDVQSTFENEIERLIKEGHKLPDILVAYEFLSQNYGEVEELELLSNKRLLGLNWTEIFTDYNDNHEEFVPRSFEPSYLSELIENPAISPDDIMIADRVSFNTGIEFDIILDNRIDGTSWRTINEEIGILNSQSRLPRVKVTKGQLDKFTSETNLNEEEVIKALVIAQNLEIADETIIEKTALEYSEERIYAECFEEKYY